MLWGMSMPYRRLGSSGLKVSALSFGALAVVDQLTPDLMKRIDAISRPVAD